MSGAPVVRFLAGAAAPPANGYDADVVILALDRVEETLAALRSALAQTGITRHVVILDQGSTQAARHALAAAVAGRTDATLYAVGENLGVAAGRTLASSLGHGRIIAALDNDAEYATPDTLAGLVRALDQDPSLGAVGCRIVTHAAGTDDLSSWGYPRALLPQAASSFEAATFVGAGHAIRRRAWEDAGGYDPALFFCWEEYDFCLRAIARGWRIRYRGDLVIRHKVSGERRVAWSGDRWFYFVRNRLYIGRKCGASWLELAPRLAAYLLKGTRNGVAGKTVRAALAASRMPLAEPQRPLTEGAKTYLQRTDAAWRGTWVRRLVREALAPLS